MGVVEGRTWLEVLSPHECLELLASTSVGRVAFLAGDHAEVMPVNYRLDGHDIVFRTDPGTKLSAALSQPQVTFQVDVIDLDHHCGWSVMVTGPARRVSDPAEIARLAGIGIEPWVHGPKANWVRIRPSTVDGRRIRDGAP